MSSESAASDRQDLWWAFYGVLAVGMGPLLMTILMVLDVPELEAFAAVGLIAGLVGMFVGLMTLMKLGEKMSGFASLAGVFAYILVPYVATFDGPGLLQLVQSVGALSVVFAVNFCVLAWQVWRKKNGTPI